MEEVNISFLRNVYSLCQDFEEVIRRLTSIYETYGNLVVISNTGASDAPSKGHDCALIRKLWDTKSLNDLCEKIGGKAVGSNMTEVVLCEDILSNVSSLSNMLKYVTELVACHSSWNEDSLPLPEVYTQVNLSLEDQLRLLIMMGEMPLKAVHGGYFHLVFSIDFKGVLSERHEKYKDFPSFDIPISVRLEGGEVLFILRNVSYTKAVIGKKVLPHYKDLLTSCTTPQQSFQGIDYDFLESNSNESSLKSSEGSSGETSSKGVQTDTLTIDEVTLLLAQTEGRILSSMNHSMESVEAQMQNILGYISQLSNSFKQDVEQRGKFESDIMDLISDNLNLYTDSLHNPYTSLYSSVVEERPHVDESEDVFNIVPCIERSQRRKDLVRHIPLDYECGACHREESVPHSVSQNVLTVAPQDEQHSEYCEQLFYLNLSEHSDDCDTREDLTECRTKVVQIMGSPLSTHFPQGLNIKKVLNLYKEIRRRKKKEKQLIFQKKNLKKTVTELKEQLKNQDELLSKTQTSLGNRTLELEDLKEIIKETKEMSHVGDAENKSLVDIMKELRTREVKKKRKIRCVRLMNSKLQKQCGKLRKELVLLSTCVQSPIDKHFLKQLRETFAPAESDEISPGLLIPMVIDTHKSDSLTIVGLTRQVENLEAELSRLRKENVELKGAQEELTDHNGQLKVDLVAEKDRREMNLAYIKYLEEDIVQWKDAYNKCLSFKKPELKSKIIQTDSSKPKSTRALNQELRWKLREIEELERLHKTDLQAINELKKDTEDLKNEIRILTKENKSLHELFDNHKNFNVDQVPGQACSSLYEAMEKMEGRLKAIQKENMTLKNICDERLKTIRRYEKKLEPERNYYYLPGTGKWF